jgi:translocation and assembly module TamB
LRLSGSLDSVELTEFSAVSKLGTIAGSGSGSWKNTDASEWGLLVDASEIDLGVVWEDWPSLIDAKISLSGLVRPSGPDVSVAIESVNGSIREYPITANGGLSYSAGKYSADQLKISLGQNDLTLNAAFENALDIEWDIAARDLQRIHPSLQGELFSSGRAQGNLPNIQATAKLRGQSLSFNNYKVQSLDAEIAPEADESLQPDESLQADESRQLNQSHEINFNIHQLVFGNQEPTDLSLTGVGSVINHSYSLAIDQQSLQVILAGDGEYTSTEQRWHGELSRADVVSDFAGDWGLKDPVALLMSTEHLSSSALCLLNDSSEVCTGFEYSVPEGLNLTAQLRELALANLSTSLPNQIRLVGLVNGDMQLSGHLDDLDGNANLAADEWSGTFESPNGTESIGFSNSRISALLNEGKLELSTSGQIADAGELTGSLTMPLVPGDTPIEGRFDAHLEDLRWVDTFLPQLSEISGEADISVSSSGPYNALNLAGDVKVNDFTAFVPRLGIELEQGHLDLSNVAPNEWVLDGQFGSGEGIVVLGGDIQIDAIDEWSGDLEISGENFEAFTSDSHRLVLSPKLSVLATPTRIKVSGTLEVPESQISIKSLPESTVYVSDDEIIVGNTDVSSDQTSETQIFADVNLVLGDGVKFDGFNIKGDLTGQLRLREDPAQPLRADGNIQIQGGSYSTYGQQFSIDPGRLIFNGPIDNPTLNVRASRKISENLVGVQIGGTAKNLSSSLYSSPVLAPTETIALLITGRPLSNATSGDGAVLLSAVTSLGLNKTTGLTQRLQNTFGLDVFTISSEEEFEDSALTIGKYLSSKIFISYAQDLFTPNSSASLDYFFSNKIRINAKSGANRSMDIFYQIKR